MHRDLKPSNLLLNEECLLKVADFGLARSLTALKKSDEVASVLTDYVATRWYRAPEILLGSTCYTKAVDMWAVGCIIAEMFVGAPFLPNQLLTILLLTILQSYHRSTYHRTTLILPSYYRQAARPREQHDEPARVRA